MSRQPHAPTCLSDSATGHRIRGLVSALIVVLASHMPAQAQMAASLVADSVTLTGQVLTARGNVSAFSGPTRLESTEIRYDGASDRMQIIGPIVVTEADGTIITAQQADLDPQLEAGILMGARLVLDRRLQLAAARADRAGPVTQLSSVAATSCHVCQGRAPLWEIRAGRVIHDTQAQRLWFRDAQLRIRGMPVAWLPGLSLPDPSARRARGLLMPRFTSSGRLGLGMKLPVFFPIGPHRDLTVTPWLSAKARALDLRYRQAFRSGDIRADFLIARDGLRDSIRYALNARADFRLPRNFQLNADLELISDNAVLLDYGLEDKDRLDSAIRLTRVDARSLTRAQITGYHTLRSDEDNDTITALTFAARHERRRPFAGGLLHWDLSADGYGRRSDIAGIGRDGLRIGAGAGYSRRWIFGPGLVLRGEAMLHADAYGFANGAADDKDGTRMQAGALVGLSWPLVRRGTAATHIVEPQLTVSWSDTWGITPPNEDARRTAFDESNLHAFNRAAGDDLTETGTRIAIGASWTMETRAGTITRLSFGRILQQTPPEDFSVSSGLATERSDWLIGASVVLPDGFSFDSRTLLADEGYVTRSESRIRWKGARVDLSAAHVFLSADTEENRVDDVSEWSFKAEWQAGRDWNLNADASYDIASARPISAGIGAIWRNECLSVGISASHRFTTLDNVPPSTNFGLDLSIEGFSAAAPSLRVARNCRH